MHDLVLGYELDESAGVLVVCVACDVGLADDSDELVAIDYRQSPDLLIRHHPDRF